MRSDHLSKHLKTHLAAKKGVPGQIMLQQTGSDDKMQPETHEQSQTDEVPLSQNASLHLKLEQNMIDGINPQEALDDSSVKLVDHNEQIKFETSC